MFNLRKEKELLKKELELYKQEEILKVDIEVQTYRQKREKEISELGKKCHEQLGQYEHVFHNTKEVRGIELAKLEAKVESMNELIKARQEVIAADNNLISQLKAEIKSQKEIITLLINKQPDITVQKLKS